MHFLLTRDPKSSTEWIEVLVNAGHKVTCLPLTKIEPPVDGYRAFDRMIQDISHYDVILLTSKTAVRIFAERLSATGCVISENTDFWTVGEATARGIQEKWKKMALYSKESSGIEGLMALLQSKKLYGRKIFWPRSNLSENIFISFLEKSGAEVCAIEAYQTKTDMSKKGNLSAELQKKPDAVVFFSPSQVEAFSQMALFDSICIAVGNTAGEALRNNKKTLSLKILQMDRATPTDLRQVIQKEFLKS